MTRAADQEARAARTFRGDPNRRALSRREQRFAQELAGRSPFATDRVAEVLREIPPRLRPIVGRRVIFAAAAAGLDPLEIASAVRRAVSGGSPLRAAVLALELTDGRRRR